jgi:hypothetical protein
VGWSPVTLGTSDGLTVYLRGVGKVSGTATPRPASKALTFTVDGRTDDRLFVVTVTRVTTADRLVALTIDSDVPLSVTVDGRALSDSPANVVTTPPRVPGRRVVQVTDPASKAWVRFTFTVGLDAPPPAAVEE